MAQRLKFTRHTTSPSNSPFTSKEPPSFKATTPNTSTNISNPTNKLQCLSASKESLLNASPCKPLNETTLNINLEATYTSHCPDALAMQSIATTNTNVQSFVIKPQTKENKDTCLELTSNLKLHHLRKKAHTSRSRRLLNETESLSSTSKPHDVGTSYKEEKLLFPVTAKAPVRCFMSAHASSLLYKPPTAYRALNYGFASQIKNEIYYAPQEIESFRQRHKQFLPQDTTSALETLTPTTSLSNINTLHHHVLTDAEFKAAIDSVSQRIAHL